ncbi:MAG: hypothetical protein GXP25_22465 [Planctomycetes bacterium]|nr:hypothetical protein [Planctomycetota bacterium]
MSERVPCFVIVFLAQLITWSTVQAEEVECFILWGIGGRWDGSLEVEKGRLLQVDPFSFEEQYGDRFHGADERKASWVSGTGGALDGIHVKADITAGTVFHLRTKVADRDLRWSDFPADRDAQVPVKGNNQFLILGRGNPDRGPKLPRSIPLPRMFQLPEPHHVVPLPNGYLEAMTIRLDEPPDSALRARRVSRNDGTLYVQIVSQNGKTSRWLSLRPRIGTVKIRVVWPDGETTLQVPTTLVEVHGTKLYVNGDPFLVKGTLPRDLNDADAEYLKSLCANTIRIRSKRLEYLDKYGFMGIVMVGLGPGRFCEKAENDAEFQKRLKQYLKGYEERCRETVKNPRLLIVQLANEQVMGLDLWSGRIGRCAFDRLDYLLARCHNILKPLDPMIPDGYSNCCFGYRTPDFLPVYLHNTYLDKDRNWPPIEEFMKFQGCDKRPYIHTEFGANVYMPQAHLRGPNTPILEKIHAWNYPNRWNTYLAAGTIGGTNYCFYDYDYGKVNTKAWDKGFTNFGVMTFDRKPKLACWELWHLWRDFEVAPRDDGTLRIRYRRDYRARNCRLTINGETRALDDFAPNSKRSVNWSAAKPFRWRMDYTTHRGLSMVACGVFPAEAEAEDFLNRLKNRKTFAFLKELFDAEVLTADGRNVKTLREMEREDGVVPIVFRKPNGVVYVTAFTRKAKGAYLESVDLDIAFTGRVEAVDEMTGQPMGAKVEVEQLPKGLRIRNVCVPKIPAAYTRRSHEPIQMPVFRIAPE